MGLTLADRCKETTTTTGTGTISLGGAQAGYRTIVAGVGSGALTDYCIADQNGGANWEVGQGTITSGTPDTLTRSTVFASSNAGALVNFAAGTKDVFVVRRAGSAPTRSMKLTNESRQSTTTLANDATLLFTVPANAVVAFRFMVLFGTPTTGGFKYALNYTGLSDGGPTIAHRMLMMGATSYINVGCDAVFGTVRNTVVSATSNALWIEGNMHDGGNGSVVSLQWAQQSSQASNTSVWQGSYVEYTKL